MSERVVVVPCFNEAHRFLPEHVASLLDERTALLLVDDGSTDDTLARLRAFADTDARVRVLALGRNVGKGEAVRAGLNEAIATGASVVGYLDADGATPAGEMRRLLAAIDEDTGCRVALGSRVALLGRHIERRAARHYLGRVFATAASVVLDAPVYDTQCGAKALRVDAALRAALATPFTSTWAFDVELLGRLLAAGTAGIVEVPLHAWRDVGGGTLGPRAMVGAGVDLARLAWRRRRRGPP